MSVICVISPKLTALYYETLKSLLLDKKVPSERFASEIPKNKKVLALLGSQV